MAQPAAPEQNVVHDRRIMHVRPIRPVRVVRPGAGWLAFAATVILGSAVVAIIWGILALANDAYWGGDPLQYGGVTAFGWLFILIGICELMVAGLVFAGSRVGAAFGLLIMLGSIAMHIATTRGHPVASGVMLAVDVAVVVVLLVFGFRGPRYL